MIVETKQRYSYTITLITLRSIALFDRVYINSHCFKGCFDELAHEQK